MRDNNLRLKIGAYILLAVAIYCLQTSKATALLIFGYQIDVMPCIVAAVALFDGPIAGAVIGLLTGVFYDVSMQNIQGISPAFYFLYGMAAGFIGQKYLRRIFSAALLVSSLSIFVIGILRILFLYGIHSAFWSTGIFALGVEILLSALFSPIVYYTVRKIHKKLSNG